MPAVDGQQSRGELEAALRKSEALAQAVLASATEGIILIDAGGRIIVVNPAAERMFGYDRGDLLGQRLEVLLPERIRGAHMEHRTGYFAGPRARPMGIGLDLAGRRKEGTEFPVEISLSYVEVLDQHEKPAALAARSAGSAHEMNNPRATMTTRIEVLLRGAGTRQLPAQVTEDLHGLHRASQRVARIAAGLRSFARQWAGERR